MIIIYCCEKCGNYISRKTALYGGGSCWDCHKLSMRGKNNPNFNNGSYITGCKNPDWIDGRSKKKCFCVDCGKELSEYRHKRCPSCNTKNERHPFFNKKDLSILKK